MNYSDKIRLLYNKRAKSYDKVLAKYRYHKTIQSIIKSIPLETKENPTILDIGCGTGLATQILQEKFPRAEIHGLDISESMLGIYKKNFPENKIMLGDFNQKDTFQDFKYKKREDIKKETYDLVISTGAISEYSNIDLSIPIIYEILKPRGVFVNIGIKKNIVSIMTGKLWHYKPSGKKRFIKICKNVGLTKNKTFRLSWKHFPSNLTKFVLIAQK